MGSVQELNEFDAAFEIAKMLSDLERDEGGKLTPKSHGILQQRLKEKLVELREGSKGKTDKDEILAAIDKAKLSILRGMHSGDKVANVLVNLVEKVRDNEDTYVWKCPECGADAAWDVGNAADAGTPMCGECDVDMKPDYFLLFDTEEWKEADAYVLRINTVRNSKKKKNGDDTDTA